MNVILDLACNQRLFYALVLVISALAQWLLLSIALLLYFCCPELDLYPHAPKSNKLPTNTIDWCVCVNAIFSSFFFLGTPEKTSTFAAFLQHTDETINSLLFSHSKKELCLSIPILMMKWNMKRLNGFSLLFIFLLLVGCTSLLFFYYVHSFMFKLTMNRYPISRCNPVLQRALLV